MMMIIERFLLAKMSGEKNIYECSGSPVFFDAEKRVYSKLIFTSETNMSTLTLGSLHTNCIKRTEHKVSMT